MSKKPTKRSKKKIVETAPAVSTLETPSENLSGVIEGHNSQHWFKPTYIKHGYWWGDRTDIDENVHKVIVWIFDTTKYAFLVGAVRFAANNTHSIFLDVLSGLLSTALLFHIQGSIFSLEFRIFNDYGVAGKGFWANVVVWLLVGTGIFLLINIATTALINQAALSVH